MLTITKNINLTGYSKTEDGQAIGTFSAAINSANAKNVTIVSRIQDKDLYIANVDEYEVDRGEFTAYANELQKDALTNEIDNTQEDAE